MKDQTSTSIHQNTGPSEHASHITHHGSEIQQSITPSIHCPAPLHLFTQSEILHQIGSGRLLKFLRAFSTDPETDSILPPASAADDGNYFDSLATAFANHSLLPNPLREALFTLENAVSPENQSLFDSTIQRCIPCVSITCP